MMPVGLAIRAALIEVTPSPPCSANWRSTICRSRSRDSFRFISRSSIRL